MSAEQNGRGTFLSASVSVSDIGIKTIESCQFGALFSVLFYRVGTEGRHRHRINEPEYSEHMCNIRPINQNLSLVRGTLETIRVFAKTAIEVTSGLN